MRSAIRYFARALILLWSLFTAPLRHSSNKFDSALGLIAVLYLHYFDDKMVQTMSGVQSLTIKWVQGMGGVQSLTKNGANYERNFSGISVYP